MQSATNMESSLLSRRNGAKRGKMSAWSLKLSLGEKKCETACSVPSRTRREIQDKDPSDAGTNKGIQWSVDPGPQRAPRMRRPWGLMCVCHPDHPVQIRRRAGPVCTPAQNIVDQRLLMGDHRHKNARKVGRQDGKSGRSVDDRLLPGPPHLSRRRLPRLSGHIDFREALTGNLIRLTSFEHSPIVDRCSPHRMDLPFLAAHSPLHKRV